MKRFLLWLVIVATTIVLHDTPPPKTQAEHLNKSPTSAEMPKAKTAQVNETKPQTQAPDTVQPNKVSQPTQQTKVVSKPVSQPEAKSNREIGMELAQTYGWSGDQWSCLEQLWTRESNWNHAAFNKSSGATGIAQALPASKMASAGSDYMTNPATQIKWGLSYIKGRYATPCNAWYQWNSRSPHWY